MYGGYSYSVKGPFMHEPKKFGKTAYATSSKCLAACNKSAKCKGCSYFGKKKKYYTSTDSKVYLGGGKDKAFSKGGKSVVNNSYIFETKASGTKIKGDYLDSTTYTSLGKAMEACAKKTGCTGFTKTGKNKYRLGKTSSVETKKGMQAYLKGSTVTAYHLKLWPHMSDMVITGQGKTALKTKKKAMIACSKNAKCRGVNKVGGKYYQATGDSYTVKSGGEAWVKGSSYTPSFTYDSKLIQRRRGD